jgi:hypothetical protein
MLQQTTFEVAKRLIKHSTKEGTLLYDDFHAYCFANVHATDANCSRHIAQNKMQTWNKNQEKESMGVGTHNHLILTTGHLSAQMSSGQDEVVMCSNNGCPFVMGSISTGSRTQFRDFSIELTLPERYRREVTRPKMLETKGTMPTTA